MMARSEPVLARYLHGSFGGFFHSEALAGALPRRQNTPQKPPFGLYPELISGTSFTVPRASNRYTWTYRIKPAVCHEPTTFARFTDSHNIFNNGGAISDCLPLQYRFRKPEPEMISAGSDGKDFLDGNVTIAVNGSAKQQDGATANAFICDKSMAASNRVFRNHDADVLIMPQEGSLSIKTELGTLEIEPLEFALVPRGIVMQVNLADDTAFSAGYCLENFGAPFALPELGPMGISSGLAHTRHFLAPEAAYEDVPDGAKSFEFIVKYQDNLFSGISDTNPFDVVAFYGNHVPCKYDLRDFMAINTVSYDHPDPSIGCVLYSPTGSPGLSNIDFVVFPPRYLVSENTFRPPWFHRNYMSEYMGLLKGAYDAKAGFVPGASSIHNQFCAHGPDKVSVEKGTEVDTLTTQSRYESTMAFMFESNKPWVPSAFALANLNVADYRACWKSLERRFDKAGPRDDPGKYPFDGRWK